MSDQHHDQHSDQPDAHDSESTHSEPTGEQPEGDSSASAESAPSTISKEPPPGAAPARSKSTKTRGKKKGKKEKKKYDSLNAYLWFEWVKPLGTILIVLGTFRTAIADWNDVPSGSMEPEVLTGDRIGVHKWIYGLHVPFTKDMWIGPRWGHPHRGDVVVAYSPDPNDPVRIVKRIVGVPGDTIEVRDGRLILNGEAVEYAEAEPDVAGRYLTATQQLADFYEEMLPTDDPGDQDGFKPHYIRFNTEQPKNRDMQEITLGDEEYFFMGDNRDESKDGRTYGITPADRIVGRAFGVAFSLNHKQFFMPRITRFFSGLR